MLPKALISKAKEVLDEARWKGLQVATAESCTGGLVAASLTEIPGSSAVVLCGYVTYSNAAKIAMLGVPEDMLAEHGAVSEQVARAMAEGALAASGADIAVSVTGVAGPTGGSAEKPVGLVHVACARREHPTIHQKCDFGDQGRCKIRELSALTALELMLQQTEGNLVA